MKLSRMGAIVAKELIQMRRDRLTFAMMVGIPVVQLVLFGFAINTDPKALPTAVSIADPGPHSRRLVAAMQTSGYFDIMSDRVSPAEASALLNRGSVAFVVTMPDGFSRELARGERPQLLIEADATDPAAASNALSAFPTIAARAISGSASASLASGGAADFDLVVHRRYNPEGITQYNIVPGLIGVILTMTATLATALSLTRETERGTMENLLAMPAKPLEIMVGKITPYIGLSFVQVAIVLTAARYLFGVPMIGSLWLLMGALLVFIAANVSLGYLFSTLARSQMQAMQMTFFFFLPSILLSGFMFPFRGMPGWAQAIGEALPLTHFLRVVRGILLKGNGIAEAASHSWPILVFLVVVTIVVQVRFRRTLD